MNINWLRYKLQTPSDHVILSSVNRLISMLNRVARTLRQNIYLFIVITVNFLDYLGLT